MSITKFKTYEDWYNEVKKRGLQLVGRFKAFDKKSNQLGKYTWLSTDKKNPPGLLWTKPGEVKIEIETVTVPFKKLSDMPGLWIMRCDSSNIDFSAYDFPSEQLYIRFKTGSKIYRYNDVPLNWWANFTIADSQGTFFHKSKHLMVDYCLIELKAK
jgi:hypothetical protein